jgi:two-component system CheB/CheR fusion protein
MVLRECLDDIHGQIRMQLFGTDIDNYAVEKAREGRFPASIAADVSPPRLKRFFIQEGDFFRIRKDIRDRIVFSVQDVLKDPPFSRLNLLCCRNLLIYLNTGAQKKLLPLFHYTLNPEGVLMLGSSETIGGFKHPPRPGAHREIPGDAQRPPDQQHPGSGPGGSAHRAFLRLPRGQVIGPEGDA